MRIAVLSEELILIDENGLKYEVVEVGVEPEHEMKFYIDWTEAAIGERASIKTKMSIDKPVVESSQRYQDERGKQDWNDEMMIEMKYRAN